MLDMTVGAADEFPEESLPPPQAPANESSSPMAAAHFKDFDFRFIIFFPFFLAARDMRSATLRVQEGRS